MLTVMHRHTDGSETIYTASAVKRSGVEGHPTIPPSGDVILLGVQGDPCCGPGAITDLSGAITIKSQMTGRTEENPFQAEVFVMNRFGATVAKYHLP